MKPTARLLPALTALISTTLACGTIASAQQVAPATPFASAVQISVVKDPQGKIVRVKSSAAPLEKFTDLASKLEKQMCYDSKLKPIKNSGYSSN